MSVSSMNACGSLFTQMNLSNLSFSWGGFYLHRDNKVWVFTDELKDTTSLATIRYTPVSNSKLLTASFFFFS